MGKGMVREFGMHMSTLLYLKWITNKDLLYSTWNSVQCHVQCLDRRGVWERMNTCICMAKSFHCSPETTTALLIGYTPRQNKKFKKKKNLYFQERKYPESRPSPFSCFLVSPLWP